MYRAQHETASGSAQPRKLSFKPNPVEPDSVLKRSVAQQAPAFQYTTTDQLRRVLHQDVASAVNADGEAVKRRKLDDGKAYDLPRLPIRATQERRPRLPPTLSGLHQPPPDAGLLPSISVDKPEEPIAAAHAVAQPIETPTVPTSTGKRKSIRGKTGRNRWSEDETRDLVQGVSRFGIGNWTKILQCPDYSFRERTALDLKDRFRVCFPEQYGGSVAEKTRHKKSAMPRAVGNSLDLSTRTHFPRSNRRQRHGFSEIEDEHLLQGYHKYGKSWSSIQQDAALELGHRTRTDLRDRMRNKFPDVLAIQTASTEQLEAASQPATSMPPPSTRIPDVLHTPPRAARQAPLVSPQYGTNWRFDPDMSFIFDEADYDQAITLDRGILDWPLQGMPESQPLSTVPGTSSTSLPSLAAVRANDSNIDDLLIHELPALGQFLTPPLEIDGRSSAHAFLSLDELLS